MIKIGINKWEAINWVQDHLGPATPRNIAEDTLKALVNEGLIETAVDEVMLIEDIDQDGLRRRARNTMITKEHRRICRTAPGHNPTHHHARTSSIHHALHEHMNVVQQGSTTIFVEIPAEDDATTPSTRPRKR